jgi:hypothetical protein
MTVVKNAIVLMRSFFFIRGKQRGRIPKWLEDRWKDRKKRSNHFEARRRSFRRVIASCADVSGLVCSRFLLRWSHRDCCRTAREKTSAGIDIQPGVYATLHRRAERENPRANNPAGISRELSCRTR